MNASDKASKLTKFADNTTTILTIGALVEEAAQKMNAPSMKGGIWFQRNKLNLNQSKTRHMIFNSKWDGNNYVRIGTDMGFTCRTLDWFISGKQTPAIHVELQTCIRTISCSEPHVL